MQNLVSLPIANELPIVNALCTGTQTNTCKNKVPTTGSINPSDSKYKSQNVQMLRCQKLLLTEQSCQSCFSEIKQVNPAEHL